MIRPVYFLLPGAILLSVTSFWVGAGLPGAPSVSGVAPPVPLKIADAPSAFGALPTTFVAAPPPAEVSDALHQRFAVALPRKSETIAAASVPVAPPTREPMAPEADFVVADVPIPPEKPCDMRSAGCLNKIGASFTTAHLDFEIRQPGYVDALDGPATSLGAGAMSDANADAPAQRTAELAVAAPVPRAAIAPGGKVIVYDASQGTNIDPLLQKNWDLNSVQVIPPLKP